jgi:hypothetical protein
MEGCQLEEPQLARQRCLNSRGAAGFEKLPQLLVPEILDYRSAATRSQRSLLRNEGQGEQLRGDPLVSSARFK